MKIVIIGGTGFIGSKLTSRLKRLGHVAIPASPTTGVNSITGEGLAEVLRGAQVVMDVTQSPSFAESALMEFFQTSGRNLMAAEKAAGVKHHLALSVVGTDRTPGSAYFRAKAAQEHLIRQSGIPYTILHATQFFEFVRAIVRYGTKENEVHVTTGLVQPIAADDVAAALAELATGSPKNDIEMAGPERMRMDEFVGYFLAENNDPRQVIAAKQAPYFGAEIDDQSLVPGENPRIGQRTFKEWLMMQKVA